MPMFPNAEFLLPFLGALIGMGIAFWSKPKSPKGLSLILAFSGSFLLGITVFHLLPEVYSTQNNSIGLWIVGGLLLQLFLEFASQGAEHGHVHHHRNNFPILILISLSLHAFVEGFPLNQEATLVWGIFIHKIPIGMVLVFLIWKEHFAKGLRLFFLFLFAIMTPLGTYFIHIANGLALEHIPLLGLVIGMLLHISTTILFESNKGHQFNLQKLLSILLGLGIAYLL